MEGAVILSSKDWQKFNQEMTEMKKLILGLTKRVDEIIMPKESGFISRKEAIHKYPMSERALSKRLKKYGDKIRRLPVAQHNLIHEGDLVATFKQKEPKPDFLNHLNKESQAV